MKKFKNVEVSGVTFTERRVLKQYEHREFTASGTVIEGLCPVEAAKELKQFVVDMIYEKGDFSHESLAKEEVKVENTVVEKKKPVKTETEKKEEAKVEESKPLPKEEKVEAKEEKQTKSSTEKTTVKKETSMKVKPSKDTNYDRTLDTHKNLLGKFLDEKYPGWRKSDVIEKATKASKELVGTAFLDADGNVLDSFKESFSKYIDG